MKNRNSAQISATGVLIIPDGTKTIKQYEYRGNDNITMVVIPQVSQKFLVALLRTAPNLAASREATV